MTIDVKNLGKRIHGIDVLSDVNITALTGHVTGFAGANGSGKTMLMRIVAGLVKPTNGSIAIDGKFLWQDIEFPPSIGLLIERPTFLDSHSGFANLTLLAGMKGMAGPREIADVLRFVGLDPEDRRTYRKYSLGMKQRLGLAAATFENPDIVLLDEPTNALDSSGIDMLKRLVFRERERGATVVLSCHDATVLRDLSDVIYYFAEGRVEGCEKVKG